MIISTSALIFFGLMRILFISNLFPDRSEPWRGLDNATLLQALRRERPDLTVRTLALRPRILPRRLSLEARRCDEWAKPEYLAVPYLPKAGGMNDRLVSAAVARWIQNHLKLRELDIVLTPWLFPDACGVQRALGPQASRQLAIAQGSDVHRYLKLPMRCRAILRMTHEVGAVITRSRDLGSLLATAGSPTHKVHPIYNGVDTECFHPGSKEPIRPDLHLPADRRVAVFVGNFLPVKGIDLLIRGIAEAAHRGPEIHLVLIGSGPLEKDLRHLANELGISDRLHWPGRLPPPKVADYMRAADVVCLSSLNEGLPNVVLEAMACGRPVISTDVGGIHEVLGRENTTHALISKRVPAAYAEALVRVLNQRTDEARISNHGASFSWQNCARHHLQIMEQLMKTLPQSPE